MLWVFLGRTRAAEELSLCVLSYGGNYNGKADTCVCGPRPTLKLLELVEFLDVVDLVILPMHWAAGV